MTIVVKDRHRLGSISERFESGGRGPGTVSGGQGDPGGVSYGTYQLASRTGTVAAFLRGDGAGWAGELCHAPGSAEFSAAWRDIAARDGEAFAAAQHAFIERTHYLPVVKAVLASLRYDLDQRHPAVRDAVWSAAVQHGGAAGLAKTAVTDADGEAGRGTSAHDRAFIKAIYQRRADYVRALAARSAPAVRRTLTTVADRRYPQELAAALALFESGD
ncbi:MAG: hypothetical protein ACKOUT_16020 [Novosphingobium sp.]